MADKKITKAQVLEMAKNQAVAKFTEILDNAGAEEVKAFVYAIPVEVDGNERWVEVTFTAKDMMTDDEGNKVPYDPFIVQANYQAEKVIKAQEKAERERRHAEAVKKAEAKRAEAKAKAQAKAQSRTKAQAKIADAEADAE